MDEWPDFARYSVDTRERERLHFHCQTHYPRASSEFGGRRLPRTSRDARDILAQPAKIFSLNPPNKVPKFSRRTREKSKGKHLHYFWCCAIDQISSNYRVASFRQRKIKIPREKLLGSEILATKYRGNCALKNSRGYPIIRKIPNEEIVHARSLKTKTAKELHCNQNMKSLKIPSSLFHFTGTTRWKCIQHDKRPLLIPHGHV